MWERKRGKRGGGVRRSEREKEGKGGWGWGGEKVIDMICESVCVTQLELIVSDSLWGCPCQSLKPFLILPLMHNFSDPSF